MTCTMRSDRRSPGSAGSAIRIDELVPAVGDHGRLVATATSTTSRRSMDLGSQLELVRRDPRDIEQVVDEPCQQRELAIADLEHPRRQRPIRRRLREVEQRAERRERVAELVREDREELVLAVIVVGELLVEPRSSWVARARSRVELRRCARWRSSSSSRCACSFASSSVRSCSASSTPTFARKISGRSA